MITNQLQTGKGGYMLKKIVTFVLVTLSVAAVVSAASVLITSAEQYGGYVKDIDTTSTSATVTLKDTGAKSYSVLYSESKDFANAETAESSDEVITVYGLKPDTIYYFKSDAFDQRANKTASIGYVAAKTEPVAQPKIKNTSSELSSITVNFQEESEIDGYRMTVSDGTAGASSRVISAVKNSINVESLSCGKTYDFEVRAYASVNGRVYYSDTVNFKSSTKSVDVPSVKSKSSTYDSIKVELNKKNVSGYTVYLADNKNYKNAKKVQSTGTSFNFSGLTHNKTYYIKAVGFVKSGSTMHQSAPVEFTCSTKSVSLGKVNKSKSAIGYSSLKIALNKQNVTGYRMWLADNKDFKNKKIGDSKTNQINFTGLQPNKTYYIKTASYVKSAGKIYYSESQTTTFKTVALPKPTVKSKTASENSVSVTLNKAKCVKGYALKVSTDKNFKTYKLVKGTSTTQKISGLKANTTYYARVYTYLTVNGKNYYSIYNTFTFKTKAYASAPSGVSIKNGMYQTSWNTWGPQYTISWKKSSGAVKYAVYTNTKRGDGYKKIATVSSTSYTVKNPSVGNHYYIIKPISSTGVEGYKSVTKGIRYVGIFSTTGYCASAGALTADGSRCAPQHTIAMGRAYAFGTKIKIGNHNCTYEVEDRGGAVTNSVIDIYFASYAEACRWGRRWIPVYQIIL